MKLIYKIETNAKLNKKAADLSAMLGLYKGCLFVLDEAYRQFVKDLRSVITSLNNQYSRTRPFEIYSETESAIHITVQGNPEQYAARLYFADVERVYNHEEGEICPLENLVLEIKYK